MWRMLQRLFGRQPRRTVLSRLRLQVEALENRLVPSASPMGALLPMKAPAIGYSQSVHTAGESKLAASPQVHKSETVALKETGIAEAHKSEKHLDALKKSGSAEEKHVVALKKSGSAEEKHVVALKKSGSAEAQKSEKHVVPLKESGMPGIPVEPDRPVHGYKWRPRPWEVGADTKYEVMRADFDFKL